MSTNHGLPFDIAIAGLGIVGTHQITKEVEETIRRSKQTFVIANAIGVATYLRTLCPKVINMSSIRPGVHRRLVYRRMASMVVSAALDNAPVCFATYGHPKLYCYPATLVQRAARVLNLRVQVFPGISCLDTLMVDLNIDPALDGLQIYDATDMVVRRRPLQNDVSCVVLQAPIVMEAYSTEGPAKAENAEILQKYLLEFYPPEHRAILLVTRTHPLLDSVRQAIPLGSLAAALQRSPNLGTLFIPPLRQREVADRHLADRLKVPESHKAAETAGPARRPGRPPIGPKRE